MGTRYELIARVGKTRGLEGKVTAHPASGLFSCLRAGLECHIVPPTLSGPRHVRVAEIEWLARGGCVLAFEGVHDIAQAEQIAGRYLLADVQDVECDDACVTLVGCAVRDERYGELGSVTELIETPANDVAVVQGRFGDVLVPLVEQTLVDLPEHEGGTLVVHVMDGLIDAPCPQGGDEPCS